MNDQLLQRIKQCPSLPSLPSIAMQVLILRRKRMSTSRRSRDHFQRSCAVRKNPPHRQLQFLRPQPACQHNLTRPGDSGPAKRQDACARLFAGDQPGQEQVERFQASDVLAAEHLQRDRRPRIAAKINIVQQEETFLVALLQDIGMLVLDQVLGEQYGEICAKAPVHKARARNRLA